jgi:tetratricopeptide (TPR) repeat protein
MPDQQSFLKFLTTAQENKEKFLQTRHAFDTIPEVYDPVIFGCVDSLAIIYRIRQNNDQYQKMLNYVLTYGNKSFNSQENENAAAAVKNKEFNSEESRCRLGKAQFTFGIYFVFAHKDPARVHQLFEWTVMNCTLPAEYLTRAHPSHCMMIAFSSLWKGYALLSLERYDEAYEYLVKVAPIYQEVKKGGREMWHTTEFTLTKALLPLCEFKRNPGRDTLKMAQNGIEDFIKALHKNGHKLEGYVYYYHLKEQFADVYSADPKKFPDTASKEENPRKKPKPVDLPQKNCNRGSVIILDPGIKSKAFAIIGTNGDFDRFIRYITKHGGFPELASLMDLYTLGNPQEAKLLEGDCTRFIRTPGIDPDIYEIGKRICSAIRVAAREDSEIVIEYQEELDPNTPE